MTAPDLEEAHYYHTIQYFNALIKKHGAKQVMDDLHMLDQLTYDDVVVYLTESKRKSRLPVAALFRKLDAS
jgi:hypothetical protein